MTISDIPEHGFEVDPEIERNLTVDQFVGREVHHYLWEKRKTQTALAAALGITQPNVSKRLRGDTPWGIAEVYAAARFLGVSINDLMPSSDFQRDVQTATAGGGTFFLPPAEASGTPSGTRTPNPLIKGAPALRVIAGEGCNATVVALSEARSRIVDLATRPQLHLVEGGAA